MSYQDPTPGQPDRQPDPWGNPDQPTSEQPVSGEPGGQPASGQPYQDTPRYQGYPPPAPGPYGTPGPYGAPGSYGTVDPYGRHLPSPDERNMAMLAHVLGILSGLLVALPFLGPLVLYLVKKDESRFVRHHAAEALNLTLTAMIVSVIAGVVGCILTFFVIGLLVIPLLIAYGITLLIYMILAAVAANRGEWYTYPAWLRFPMVS